MFEADLLALPVVSPSDDQTVVAGTEEHEVDVGEVDFDPGSWRHVPAAAEEEPTMSYGVLPDLEAPVGSEDFRASRFRRHLIH
ncbi:hypothetical protein [Streptomyces hundungensis]|uniref:hypothetical protein n=1 Tax=Streptomyces hundungensis TaxID=1077946 RepID=UPI0013C40E54|nr:hypothetical protein [Streptomyces hundungensis]